MRCCVRSARGSDGLKGKGRKKSRRGMDGPTHGIKVIRTRSHIGRGEVCEVKWVILSLGDGKVGS